MSSGRILSGETGVPMITYFLRFPERLQEGDVSTIDSCLQRMFILLKDAYHLDKVPAVVAYDEPKQTNRTLCDGLRLSFVGSPKEGFDFEGLVAELWDDAVVSKGADYRTGEQSYVVMTPHLEDMPKKGRVMQNFDNHVMMAMAQASMANGQYSNVSFSSEEDRNKVLGLLREAKMVADH